MSGIGARVKKAREAMGLSQQQLADKIDQKQQAIQALETGRARNSLKVVDIARALNVTVEWLQGADGLDDEPRAFRHEDPAVPALQSDRMIEIAGAEFARLPVYDIRFAAGHGTQNYEEEPIDYHLVSMAFLRSVTDAPLSMIGVFQADGDSMEPTINNRDWVIVDQRRTQIANPGIYALVFEGEGLLKRAQRHLETGAVTLTSDNPKYDPQTIKKPERLQVVGRVFLSIRRH